MASAEKTHEITLTPGGLLGEYLVRSEADPGIEYSVDLMAFDGEGSCTCDDYNYRIMPLRQAELKPIHRSCKHIDRAYVHFGRHAIQYMLKNIKEGKMSRD